MFIHRLRIQATIAMTVFLMVATTISSANAQQGFGERLGQRLDDGISRLSGELQEGWASLRQSVDRMGVQGRVYSRLRWDKQIATSKIDVDSAEAGVVILRGELLSSSAKEKAIRLAEDTVGVERVVDELTIALASTP